MANILLMEPDYKCKYPPLGLMKIGYYHKEHRKDTVWFCKGRLPEKISEQVKKQMRNSKYYQKKFPGNNLEKHFEEVNNIIKNNLWDKVYVCTLFTFEYEKTIEAVDYAKELVGKENVYSGGIMATLMTEKFRNDTGIHVNPGQLTNSNLIGYKDNINIDVLTPDYSILDNIEYKYENNNAYYAYTTRGCGMNCGFCAVKTLEPTFVPFISIKNQINNVKELYGEKKDLLLMDNNILKSKNLKAIVEEIKELGFQKGATYRNPKTGKVNVRFVDFNQGLDAYLMTEEKAKMLGKIAIRPARIAFDHIEDEQVYVKAITLAANNGINHLSNYILYNSEDFTGKGKQYKADTPKDLYRRLKINVDLQESLNKDINEDEEKIHIFSFPMRYIPLDDKQRGHVGSKWTKKSLRAVQTILIPTQGKGVSSKSYFEAAFGKDEDGFVETLLMPEMYIASRGEPDKIKNISEEERKIKIDIFNDFKELRDEWKKIYNILSEEERNNFEDVIADNQFNKYHYDKLVSDKVKELYIHYGTSPGILTLTEELSMEERAEEVELIRNYLKCGGKNIYKELLSYVLKSKKINKRISAFKLLFGYEGLRDLLRLWIQHKCAEQEFIQIIKNVYNFNPSYLSIMKLLIVNESIGKEKLEELLLALGTPVILEKMLEETLKNLYSKVMNKEAAENIKVLLKDIKTAQLSFF